MYSIDYTHQFKKDLRKCAKRGLDIDAIKHAIKILSATGTLPEEYRPHQLKGDHRRVTTFQSICILLGSTAYFLIFLVLEKFWRIRTERGHRIREKFCDVTVFPF